MNILLIEDNEDKIQSISNCINQNLDNCCQIEQAKNMTQARRQIISKIYDLIIFDIYLPVSDFDKTVIDVSSEIVSEYSISKNYQTEAIVITQHEEKLIENTKLFNETGITVVNYSKENTNWQESLKLKISRNKDKIKYDFLIFCALTKERAGYYETHAKVGERKILKGLNCQDISIGRFKGLCITPSKMGLVNMAILASKAIEAFQPKIVAMSGICAGVKGESKLLDLIIGNVCWEYQTGKYKDNEFKQEPYQVPIESLVKTEIEQLIDNNDIINEIKKGLFQTELKESEIILGPISSGSAVIASAEKMAKIGMQHRKMAGLEMEMYSLYEAANQSLSKPLFFGAKAVVDLGDSSKADSLHSTASTISARFVVTYLDFKLAQLD